MFKYKIIYFIFNISISHIISLHRTFLEETKGHLHPWWRKSNVIHSTIIMTLLVVENFAGILVCEGGKMIMLSKTVKWFWLVNTEQSQKSASSWTSFILGTIKDFTFLFVVESRLFTFYLCLFIIFSLYFIIYPVLGFQAHKQQVSVSTVRGMYCKKYPKYIMLHSR